MLKPKIHLPTYILIEGKCAMRLVSENELSINGSVRYWRDGGAWGTNVKMNNGQLITCGHSKSMSYLNGKIVTECSEYVWYKDNGQYAGKILADRVRKMKTTLL